MRLSVLATSLQRVHSKSLPSSHYLIRPHPLLSVARRRFSQTPRPQWELGQGLVVDTPEKARWKEDEKAGWKTWVTAETPGKYVFPYLCMGPSLRSTRIFAETRIVY